MKNPPAGWSPQNVSPKVARSQGSSENYTLREALKTWQWWAQWAILFLNTTAGIAIISQESPLFQELARVSVAVAAGMVGIASIGNALGRVLWAWISDSITRRATFIIMYVIQVVLFWTLPGISTAAVLTAVAFVILLCYGGGFGTMPAFTADYFGSQNVGPIYGLMLTAWGAASAFGPLLIAHMRQTDGNFRGALHLLATIMLVSIALPLVVSPPRRLSVMSSTQSKEREAA
jgi:OFA family oxalate/formate antiporter-like MFS transporter